jgi:hypothetical protein
MTVGASASKRSLDPAAERWVEETKNKLTLDEQIGQLTAHLRLLRSRRSVSDPRHRR